MNLLICKVSSKNQKPKKKNKKTYLGIFGLRFNKNYYQIFNQHPQIFETIKFHPKRKKNKLGNKNAFGFLNENVEKLLSYL